MGGATYSRGYRATILVVDDEVSLRGIMVRALRDAGYRVLGAGDGLEALRLIADAGTIDLVITDIGMPRMDGRTLAAQLLASEASARMLFISAQPPEDFPLPGPFLEKPFTPSTLAATVTGMLAAAPR